MHMADGFISPAVGCTMWAASAAITTLCARKVRQEKEMRLVPLMGVLGAFIFACQMLNFTIPGTGSSGHLGGGLILAVLLGPYAGFLVMAAILTVQALFFADGGLLALGCNIFNMGFFSCLVAYPFIYRPLAGTKTGTGRITLASVIAAVIGLQMGAFSVVLETTASGISALPFAQFVELMLPIHLAIGLIEGLITAAVLLFLYEARPELLRDVCTGGETAGKVSFKGTIAVIALAAVLVGGGLSLLASGNPDGLEWSLFGNSDAGYTQNMGLDEDSYGVQSSAADKAGAVQEKTAFLPDYSFAGSDSAAGTSVSGIAGAAIVAAAAALICGVGGICRHKKRHQS